MKKLIFLFCLISTALISQPVLTGRQGGTGVANTNKTITLGASITTTGTASPTLAFPSTSRTFTFPDSSDRVALLHWTLPRTGTISGYPLTNRIEFKTGTTALSSTLTPYYIGYGNNLDLSSATAFAHAKFGTDGFGQYQNIFSIKGSTAESYLTLSESVGINMYSNLIASPTSYANVDISGGNFTAGHYASNGNSYITFQPSGVANITSTYTLFPGLKYDATTAGYVTTNQTQYSLLHRAAGDARWLGISYSVAPTSATSPLSLSSNTVSLNYGTGLTVTSNSLQTSPTQTHVTSVGTVTAGVWNSGVSSPTFSGTVTGTYTLAGTPTITSPVLSGTSTGTHTIGGTTTISSATCTTCELGSSTATTQAYGDNSTKVATTAYIAGNIISRTFTVNATTTSTVAATISNFTFTAQPNAEYFVVATIRQNCNNTGGIKYAVTIPGTSTMNMAFGGSSTNATGAIQSEGITTSGTLSAAYNTFNGSSNMVIYGRVTADGTGGTVSIQFASAVSGQTSLVGSSSGLIVHRTR